MSDDREQANVENLLTHAGPEPECDPAVRAALWSRLEAEQDSLVRRRRARTRFWRAAAAAVLLVAAGAGLRLMNRPAPVPSPDPAPAVARVLPGELLALLSDPEDDLRLYAVGMIGRYGTGEHVNEVARVVLEDRNPAIRRAARCALHSVWEREESVLERRPR